MIKLCADKITLFLISNNQIDKDDFEMYVYAYETLIAFIVNIIVILTISCVLKRFTYTLWFLCWYFYQFNFLLMSRINNTNLRRC
ncbi:accessory gene regulator B family protein [Romboutsia lituseburensis]|uniref:accessory gene regulator B family protein n=1 Tax=Romboutsia lituseburensis TaxID=1537 RepID=UPI003B5093D2